MNVRLFRTLMNELHVTSYRLQATSYKLQVTSYKLQATSYKLQVADCHSRALSRFRSQHAGAPSRILPHASAAHIRRKRCDGSRSIASHLALERPGSSTSPTRIAGDGEVPTA